MPQDNFHSNYGYSESNSSLIARPEYKYILNWIETDQKVLDIGCGEGSLGKQLIDQKKCTVHGLEISAVGTKLSNERGLIAQHWNVDDGIPFADNFFDVSICNVTIQMVYRPGFVIEEMMRVSKTLIISFPNFAFWKSRLQLLLVGKMPWSTLYGYHWHNTRHIHHLSINDFKDIAKEKNLTVSDSHYLGPNSRTKTFLSNIAPNIFSAVAIFKLEK